MYTENKSIDGLTAITPTTDDLVVTMDQAEVGVAKSSTLLSIYNLFKTTYDTVYAKYLGDADFYKYSIVTSVASGNLTVALKNYEGNDPTPTKPVKIQIGGVIRTITSATSYTRASGVNWMNCGSAELATKEIDFFTYLYWSGSIVKIAFGRIVGTIAGDFPSNALNEKFMEAGYELTATDPVANIGRFNAILSAGYTWSIPATSVIINRPIYETRWLDANSTVSATAPFTVSNIVINHFKYKIVGDNIFYKNSIKLDFGGTGANFFFETLPFGRNIIENYDIAGNSFGYDNNDIAPSVIFESTDTSKLRIIKIPAVYALVTNATIKTMGNYKI